MAKRYEFIEKIIATLREKLENNLPQEDTEEMMYYE